MKPGHAERIGHLFLRGYSLDLISELGMTNGAGPNPAWTREDARSVLDARGWSLDTFGRLHPESLARERFGDVLLTGPSVADIETDHLINIGVDHENEMIRTKAKKVVRGLEELRATLLAQEKADAARVAVAMIEEKPAIPDSRHVHGSLEGYRVHQVNGTTICMSCQSAYDRVASLQQQAGMEVSA